MEILKTPEEMRAWRRALPVSLGLTPTMGYLHEGHLSLVRRSLAENEASAASIFVNPTQFGPNEDFDRYPRDEEGDLRQLRELGVDAVYLPSVETMYPEGYQTYVTVEGLSQGLEGGSRPVHFRGVATVVTKLLIAVAPDRAYFGKKDAQQLRVIRRLARDFDLPVEIVGCDTVREEGRAGDEQPQRLPLAGAAAGGEGALAGAGRGGGAIHGRSALGRGAARDRERNCRVGATGGAGLCLGGGL